jgi:hypothetical protein
MSKDTTSPGERDFRDCRPEWVRSMRGLRTLRTCRPLMLRLISGIPIEYELQEAWTYGGTYTSAVRTDELHSVSAFYNARPDHKKHTALIGIHSL